MMLKGSGAVLLSVNEDREENEDVLGGAVETRVGGARRGRKCLAEDRVAWLGAENDRRQGSCDRCFGEGAAASGRWKGDCCFLSFCATFRAVEAARS